jgi:hypothetical protein
MDTLTIGIEQFSTVLDDSLIVMPPRSFFRNQTYRVSRSDGHWNAEGHRQVALMLYHFIQSQGLLPMLSLPRWEEAETAWRILESDVQRELHEATQSKDSYRPKMTSEIDLNHITNETARQIYGGLFTKDGKPFLGPYASFVVGRGKGKRLLVEGRFLTAPMRDGASVDIYCEECLLKTLIIDRGKDFSVDEPLPSQLLSRPYLNVLIVSNDYIYAANDLRQTVSLQVFRVAIH